MKTKHLISITTLFFSLYTGYSQPSWTQKSNFGGTPRHSNGFSIGTKGYIGTGYDGTVKSDFWEWDQTTNVWTQKADFGGGPRYQAASLSIGNKGYIGLGTASISPYNFVKDLWEYDPSANLWLQKATFPGMGRYTLTGISIGNKGYFGLGWDGTLYNDWWEYDPASDVWTQKANFGGVSRQSAIGFVINGKGYVGTGYKSGTMKKDFWEYDPLSDSWSQISDFGGSARAGGAAFVLNGQAYVGNGNAGYPNPNYQKDFWKYDPGTDAWTLIGDFAGTARAGGASFSIGNFGYIGTGDDGVLKNDFWEFSPQQQDTCFITVYDTVTVFDTLTVYDSIAVTDTLIIDVSLGLNPPNETNLLKIYPNPSNDHITIENGNFVLMNGYSLEIKNSLSQQVFQSSINQQQFFIDLSSWTGNGTYFVYIYDPQSNLVDVRKIILQ